MLELRAKAALFDELVEALTRADDEVERLRSARAGGGGIDPAWREIANDLASALRPYSLFRDQVVQDGRIVVETRVPGATLSRTAGGGRELSPRRDGAGLARGRRGAAGGVAVACGRWTRTPHRW